MTAPAFDPTNPDTWPATYDGGVQVGTMLMDEFSEIIQQFVTQRLNAAILWVASHGGDDTILLRAFADTLRQCADTVEGRGGE